MTRIQRSEPYRKRSIRFLELWHAGEWRIKVYGISAESDRPPRSLLRVGKEFALKELPRPAVTDNRYGVGFLIVHAGLAGNHVLVDWWVNRTMLKHHVYSAPGDRTEPEDFRYVTPTGICGRIWDLHVLHFERSAWMTSVLDRESGSDLDEYLLQRFSGEV